jgi:hypothetical protein
MQFLILRSLNRLEDGVQRKKRISRLWALMAGPKGKSPGCVAHSAGEHTQGSMQKACGGGTYMRNTRLPCRIVVRDTIALAVAADLAGNEITITIRRILQMIVGVPGDQTTNPGSQEPCLQGIA